MDRRREEVSEPSQTPYQGPIVPRKTSGRKIFFANDLQ